MKISRIGMTAFGFLLLAVSLSHAQEKIRILEHRMYRQYDISTEPIAIVSREVGDKPFMDDYRVVGSPDWLRHLTLGIKNISDKTIKDFTISFIIPKHGALPVSYGMSIRFPTTREPVLDDNGMPTGIYRATQVLEPGETVKLKIDENQLRILDKIKAYGVFDIGWVSMVFDTVTFDDGIRWKQGLEMKEDPDHPGAYRPIRPDNPESSRNKLYPDQVLPSTFLHTIRGTLAVC